MAHCFSVVDNFDGKFVKAIMELPFTGEFVTDGWLPSILVNLHGSHEQLKNLLKFSLRIERSDNTCHQFSLFSSNAWLLNHDRQPNVRANNLLTNFRTWIALTGKMLGKSSSGKVVLCWVQVRFRTFFILVIRIKMRVWVLFRLQIESPIRSEKDFTSANMFIQWNHSAMNFWQKIFFPNLEFLNSGCGLSASAAYTPVFTVSHPIFSHSFR